MNPNDYEKQKLRALSRKKELVKLMGCKCSICGYYRNYAALEFHHVNPEYKSFQLDSRHLSNTTMATILEEVKKCILVCSNCHKEIHYPNMELKQVENTVTKNRSLFETKRKQATCPVCSKKFNYMKGKIYCSAECRMKDKNYPSYEEVKAKYNELKSQKKVGEYFGLTRKIIIGILKKQ